MQHESQHAAAAESATRLYLQHMLWCLQMAHSIQQQWPLREPHGKQSPFELNIYYTLVQMGYQAVPSYDSEDGLHFIDIALLPQKKLPCKIAVEADGGSHFLYEDYRLENAPGFATRYGLLAIRCRWR